MNYLVTRVYTCTQHQKNQYAFQANCDFLSEIGHSFLNKNSIYRNICKVFKIYKNRINT